MNRTGAAAVLAAVLVVLAGCSGGLSGGSVSPGDAGTAAGSGAGGEGSDGGTADVVADPSGSVNFYVSDRPGAIEDFAHLNVTVTTVRFHLVEPANDSTAVDGNATTTTVDAIATTTTTATTTATTTTADDAETEVEDENETEMEAQDGAEMEAENEAVDESERDDEGEDGRWVVREVNATTVDLTELRGDNATLVEAFDVPAGEYNKVFLEVSDVDATPQDGESATVKLPSGKLQLTTGFEVENGSEVDFVYDIMVHKAGNSGKYILRPVLSESGTDQPIERVDERGRPVEGEREDADRDASALTVRPSGELTPGENVTLEVTDASGSVANATVTVNGEAVGTTDPDGTITVAVPEDAEELEIEVAADDREGELERDLGGDREEDGDGDDGDDGGDGGPPDDSPGNGSGQGNGGN